jgi:hypothetical protein
MVKDIDTTEPTRKKTSTKKDKVLPKSLKNYSYNSYFITEYFYIYSLFFFFQDLQLIRYANK